jgi:hypothetical protein
MGAGKALQPQGVGHHDVIERAEQEPKTRRNPAAKAAAGKRAAAW